MFLNIYDLHAVNHILAPLGIGAFHGAVQVYGVGKKATQQPFGYAVLLTGLHVWLLIEWAYGGSDTDVYGVYCMKPMHFLRKILEEEARRRKMSSKEATDLLRSIPRLRWASWLDVNCQYSNKEELLQEKHLCGKDPFISFRSWGLAPWVWSMACFGV